MRWARRPSRQALAGFAAPARAATGRPFAALYRALRAPGLRWPADIELVKDWYLPHLERLHDDAQVRAADVEQLAALAGGYGSRESFLTELTLDPPEATSDRAGPPQSRRGLPDPVDHPLGQGPGVEVGARAERGRRLHPVRHGDRQRRRHRGRTAPAVRGDDARQGALHLVVPNRFFIKQQAQMGDRHVYAARTRFITPAMLKHFEECAG
jgi:DNA helicase-2/ATP-dependent DNA helicase PcrA